MDIEERIAKLRLIYGKDECTIRIDSDADGWRVWVDYDLDDTGTICGDYGPTIGAAFDIAERAVAEYRLGPAWLDMSRAETREAQAAAWPDYAAYFNSGGTDDFWTWFHAVRTSEQV